MKRIALALSVAGLAVMASGCAVVPRRDVCRPAGTRQGAIDLCTGRVYDAARGRWVPGWWQAQFDVARRRGCHLEDSCGTFPPYRIGAEYCGEPVTVCPGQTWRSAKGLPE